MKENKYDDPVFFQKYSEMNRSKYGLQGAGEWQEFQKMMPDFTDKEVLDLGCGYGWHCAYGVQKGAAKVLGIDLSEKMLRQAEKINSHEKITYQRADMEDLEFPDHSFDIVLSSLAFHYVKGLSCPCREDQQMAETGGNLSFFCGTSRIYRIRFPRLVL